MTVQHNLGESTMTNTLDLTTDLIDVREIIERIEELETLLGNEDGTDEGWMGTDAEWDELAALQVWMSEMKGYGGDEQWRGDWYPVTLIAESYFVEYIKDLIHDCYEMPKEMHSGDWPYRHMTIDYDAAAKEAEADYMTIEIEGVDYFYR
jgi:hypothetical protein